VTAKKSPVMELMTSKRSCVLVNRTVGGSLSLVEFTEVSMVDTDGTADEADTDVDAADGDTAGGGLDAIDAMAKCC